MTFDECNNRRIKVIQPLKKALFHENGDLTDFGALVFVLLGFSLFLNTVKGKIHL